MPGSGSPTVHWVHGWYQRVFPSNSFLSHTAQPPLGSQVSGVYREPVKTSVEPKFLIHHVPCIWTNRERRLATELCKPLKPQTFHFIHAAPKPPHQGHTSYDGPQIHQHRGVAQADLWLSCSSSSSCLHPLDAERPIVHLFHILGTIRRVAPGRTPRFPRYMACAFSYQTGSAFCFLQKRATCSVLSFLLGCIIWFVSSSCFLLFIK